MRYLAAFLSVFIYVQSFALIKLYVSRSTGQVSSTSGTYPKTTDNYERGSFNYTTIGPISVTVTPPELSIGINETKSWTGVVKAVLAGAAAEGDSTLAYIKYNGTTYFSRPATGVQTATLTIESTHRCGGCPKHPNDTNGRHEVMKKITNDSFEYVVYTLGLEFEGRDCVHRAAEIKQKAKGFPAGGSYTWKNLTPNVMTMAANGDSATFTCKTSTGVGTGKIEVSYTIGEVMHKETKEIIFFALIPKLSDASICDGTGVTVTLERNPSSVTPAQVKAAVDSLKIAYKPVITIKDAKPANIVKHTNINFSAVNDRLESKADTIYWFIPDTLKDLCIYNSKYEIWATGVNTANGQPVKTPVKELNVGVHFGSCVAGDANVTVDMPDLNRPVYNRPDTNGNQLLYSSDGAYPTFTLTETHVRTLRNGVRMFKMKGQFSPGNFKLAHTVSRVRTGEASQFYPLVKFEEEYHVAQFGGATQIQELKNLLSAKQVVDTTNKLIRESDEYSEAYFGRVYNQYLIDCWATFSRMVRAEVTEYNNLSAVWATQIRCRLEAEAKQALKDKWGTIFIADMPCAYKKMCPQYGKEAKEKEEKEKKKQEKKNKRK